MAQLATVATIQAAEIGKQFNFTQNSSGPNFTGSIVELLVSNSAGIVSIYTCDVSSGSPIYTTTGAEFANAGSYVIQLKYTHDGEVYYSPEGKVVVLANLS